MKNQLLVLFALVLGGSSFGQLSGVQADNTAERPHPGHTGIIHDDDRADPFWEEDFSGGFPSDWAVIDSSGLCPWTYTFDGSWGFWNGTDATEANDPMNSTTAGNGYLICDNDSANHFTYGQPSGTTYEYLSSWFGTSSIDCSGEASVILRFEQYYRYNNGVGMYVKVSTDSATWTYYNVSGGIPDNSFSDDPTEVALNISSIAAGETNVYLQFGWSARVYFWSIDDISLSPAEPNDLVMESGFWRDQGVNEFQQYKIPVSQPTALTFRGGISNNTGSVLNDVFLDVDVNDGGGSVFTGTSPTVSLAATELDTLDLSTEWDADAVGSYTVTYNAELSGTTDSDLSNNMMMDSFQVTASTYGMDNLTDGLNGATGSISNWSGNTGQPFGIGNLYEIYQDDEVQCVEIGVTNVAEHVGEIIYGIVYVWNGSEWEYRGGTEDYSIQPGEEGTIISIPMDEEAFVGAGELMLVCAGHYGGTDVSFAMAQGVPDQTVYGFDGAGTFFWLSSARAIVCRANFQCGLGTEELENTFDVTTYPNPFVDELNVSMNLVEATDVTIDLIDIQGRVISTEALKFNAGEQTYSLNSAGLSAGVYTLKITANEITTTKKVVLER